MKESEKDLKMVRQEGEQQRRKKGKKKAKKKEESRIEERRNHGKAGSREREKGKKDK